MRQGERMIEEKAPSFCFDEGRKGKGQTRDDAEEEPSCDAHHRSDRREDWNVPAKPHPARLRTCWRVNARIFAECSRASETTRKTPLRAQGKRHREKVQGQPNKKTATHIHRENA
eukprot:2111007-Rhodomonas_salina.1